MISSLHTWCNHGTHHIGGGSAWPLVEADGGCGGCVPPGGLQAVRQCPHVSRCPGGHYWQGERMRDQVPLLL